MHTLLRESRLVATALGAAVLVGCSANGLNNVTIEDRSINSGDRIPRNVEQQAEGVEVTALKV
ncbi:MAG: hypothetical protein ACPG4U_09640, partial [Pseudomonadales bacterium]